MCTESISYSDKFELFIDVIALGTKAKQYKTTLPSSKLISEDLLPFIACVPSCSPRQQVFSFDNLMSVKKHFVRKSIFQGCKIQCVGICGKQTIPMNSNSALLLTLLLLSVDIWFTLFKFERTHTHTDT